MLSSAALQSESFQNSFEKIHGGMPNIIADAMDAATYQDGRMVFFLVIGVILVDIMTGIIIDKFSVSRELKYARFDMMKNARINIMNLFGAPPAITQRSAPSAAGGSTTSIRSGSRPPLRTRADSQYRPDLVHSDSFDRGLTLGFEAWLAVPGATFEEQGMRWNETATHATLSLPVTPEICKSLKVACKGSPEDPTASRVVKLRWTGGQLVLPLSDRIRCTEMAAARVSGGCLRLPMKKVTPGKWGSLVAIADTAVPGAAFEEHGMTWNETATHAMLSLPVTPAMCKSLQCECKRSPEDPATSRVITLRWAGGQLMLPLSGLVLRAEVGPARVTGGCLRLPMKKVAPGTWGSLVAVADAAALNSSATAPAKKPAAESAAASAEQQPAAAAEDVVAELEQHEAPPPPPALAGETGESPCCVAQFDDESLGCLSGDCHAAKDKVPDLVRPNLEVPAWKEKEHSSEAMMRDGRAPDERAAAAPVLSKSPSRPRHGRKGRTTSDPAGPAAAAKPAKPIPTDDSARSAPSTSG